MTPEDREFSSRALRLIALQAGIGALVALGFALKTGTWSGLSAMYGAGVSIVIASVLTWGVIRASRAAERDKKKSAVILYLGGAQRFLLVLALIGLGLAVIKLEPIALLSGFCLAQASYLLSMRGQRNTKTS